MKKSVPIPPVLLSQKIPFLKGRPEREDPIVRDDIVNLLIALEIHRDVSQFLDDRHLFS